MIISIEFEYGASVIPAGRRSSIEVRLVDTHEVEVVDLTDLEAPVAVRLPHSPDHGPQDLRFHGDSLHVRAPEGSIEAFIRGPRAPRETRGMGDFRTVHSTRTSVISEMEKRAEKLFCVDGVVFEPVQDPLLSVSLDGRVGYVGHGSSIEMADSAQVFRLDELDVLRECLPAGAPEVDPAALPEVLMASALRRNPLFRAIYTAADEIKSRMESELKFGDVAFFTSYAKIRDLMPSWGSQPDQDHSPLVKAIVSAVGQHERLKRFAPLVESLRFRHERTLAFSSENAPSLAF